MPNVWKKRRVRTETAWTATPPQLSLWIDSELVQDTSTYVLARAYELTGPIDVDALARAIETVMRRQTVFRTRIRFAGDELVQEVVDENPVLDVTDVTGLDDREVGAAISAREAAPFDLSRELPARWHLLRRGPELHVLLFVTHHVVCDGQSLEIVFEDLVAAYAGERCDALGDDAAFGSFAASFGAAKPAMTTGAPASVESESWPSAAAGDAHRAEDESASCAQTLSSASRQRLAAACAAHGVSDFTVMLAAFGSALRDKAGMSSVSVFVPYGYHDDRYRHTSGYFIRPMYVELTLEPPSSAAAEIERARDALFGAIETVLFDAGTDAKPARRAAVGMAAEFVRDETIRLGDARGRLLDARRTCKFDLFLAVQGRRDETRFYLDYRPRQLNGAWVRLLADAMIEALDRFTE